MTTDDDPSRWSARRVASAIAAKTISAREYLEVLAARIERYNPALGLVVTRNERAFEEAAAADDAVVRGEYLPPLHGVAMTVKDSLATAGLRTTGGEPALSSYTPREDAAAVAGVRRAGAIILGKTNLPRGSGDLQAYNDMFGTARNPWKREVTTSGSSGGAAGALAAGFTPLEIGSDTAGSIRVPAAFCGVFGHKPSFGVVSTYGHVPPMPFRVSLPDMLVVGPMARDTDDLAVLFDAMTGAHPWDQAAWQLTLPHAHEPRRVAVWLDSPDCRVDDEVQGALEFAADLLSTTGITVDRTSPPGISLAASDRIFRRLLATVAVTGGTPDKAESSGGQQDRTAVLGGEHVDQSYREWVVADELRTRLRRRWQAFFTDYDALLLPVSPNTAPAHDHRPFAERTIIINGKERPYWEQITWAGVTGMCYLPSTVVPVRLDSHGVPLGIAVAGPYLGDRTTLAVARILERLIPPLGRPSLADTVLDFSARSSAADRSSAR
jgi:amidase